MSSKPDSSCTYSVMHFRPRLHLHVQHHAFFTWMASALSLSFYTSIAPQVRKKSCHTCNVTLQGVDMMTAKLTNSLRGADVTVRQAAEAMKHLLHLHAESARSTKNLDPVKLYLEAQVRSISRLPNSWYVRFSVRPVRFVLNNRHCKTRGYTSSCCTQQPAAMPAMLAVLTCSKCDINL